jgi:hypothetical protein
MMFKILVLVAFIAAASAQSIHLNNNTNGFTFPASYNVSCSPFFCQASLLCDCNNQNVTGLCPPPPPPPSPVPPPTSTPSPVPAPHNPCSDIANNVSNAQVYFCLQQVGIAKIATGLCPDASLPALALYYNISAQEYGAIQTTCDAVFMNTSCTFHSSQWTRNVGSFTGQIAVGGTQSIPQIGVAFQNSPATATGGPFIYGAQPSCIGTLFGALGATANACCKLPPGAPSGALVNNCNTPQPIPTPPPPTPTPTPGTTTATPGTTTATPGTTTATPGTTTATPGTTTATPGTTTAVPTPTTVAPPPRTTDATKAIIAGAGVLAAIVLAL